MGPDSAIEVIRLACQRRKCQLIILSAVLDRSKEDFANLARTVADRLLPFCPVIIGGKGTSDCTDLLENHGIQCIDELNTLHNFRPSIHRNEKQSHRTFAIMTKEHIQ